MQCNVIQYNTTQHKTKQSNTIQYNTTQRNAIKCFTIQRKAMQRNAIQYQVYFNTFTKLCTMHHLPNPN